MKISNLPKTTKPTSSDLLTIVQGGKVKNISVSDLTKVLTLSGDKLAAELRTLKKDIQKNTLNKNNPVLVKPLKVPSPKVGGDASNKSYVDTKVAHLIKVDGSSKISAPLTYDKVTMFSNDDLINKRYADSLLVASLKTIKELDGSVYPRSAAGDTYISMKEYPKFALNGPSVQKGDIIICTAGSAGGTHGEVGTQFAIINTNVVFATEEVAGILKLSSSEDSQNLTSSLSAMSPRSIREVLEGSSMFNRRLVDFNAFIAKESDRGIIAADSRRGSVSITLPSVKSLQNPKLTKFVIKDEYGYADINNIVVSTSSQDTIESAPTLTLNQKYQAVSIYNDGKDYYIESNTHNKRENISSGSGSGILKSAAKKYALVLNADDPIYSFDIDLSEYDVNEGFEIEYYGSFSDTTNNSADIMINSVSIATTGTISAVGTFKLTATVLKSSDLRAYIVSSIAVDGVVVNNNFASVDLDNWLSTFSVQGTLKCATALNDALGHMFIVKPLK